MRTTGKSDYDSRLRESTRKDLERLSTVNLWRAVLSQACRDLASPYKRAHKNIADWLDTEEEYILEICDFAEVDGEQFVRQMKRLCLQPQAERRDQLLAIALILYRPRGKLDEEDNFFTKLADDVTPSSGSAHTASPTLADRPGKEPEPVRKRRRGRLPIDKLAALVEGR